MNKMIQSVMNTTDGKKSYFAGYILMIHAVSSLMLGEVDFNAAFNEFMLGFGIVSVRHGISKIY